MSDEEKIKWFDRATTFVLNGKIRLTMKSYQDGNAKWAILDTGENKVLNSNLEWEPEPPFKQRDENFMIRARFSFDDALSLFEQYKMFAQ